MLRFSGSAVPAPVVVRSPISGAQRMLGPRPTKSLVGFNRSPLYRDQMLRRGRVRNDALYGLGELGGFSLSKLFKKAKRALDKHGDAVGAVVSVTQGGNVSDAAQRLLESFAGGKPQDPAPTSAPAAGPSQSDVIAQMLLQQRQQQMFGGGVPAWAWAAGGVAVVGLLLLAVRRR